jgi:hypothetical protein
MYTAYLTLHMFVFYPTANTMSAISQWVVLSAHHLIRFLAWLTAPVFRRLYDGAHRGLPTVNDPVLMMRAVEIAKKIRKREVCHFGGLCWKSKYRVVWLSSYKVFCKKQLHGD